MNIQILYSETELKDLVIKDLKLKLGEIPLDKTKVTIEVKSKQNYKSEWEIASFRAVYNHINI